MTSVVLVEDSSENRGRIEMREAQLGDRSRDGDEGRRAHISDQSMVLKVRVARRVGIPSITERRQCRVGGTLVLQVDSPATVGFDRHVAE